MLYVLRLTPTLQLQLKINPFLTHAIDITFNIAHSNLLNLNSSTLCSSYAHVNSDRLQASFIEKKTWYDNHFNHDKAILEMSISHKYNYFSLFEA